MPRHTAETADAELISRYLRGDESSLNILVKRYLPEVYSFARRYSGDADKAADITQEIFVKVWKNIRKFDRKKNFRPWLFAIAKNTSLDWLRRKEDLPFSVLEGETGREAGEFFVSPGLSLEDGLDISIMGRLAEAKISELPELHRQTVLMRGKDGFSFKEIAEVLHEPLNTVKSRYRRAILAVRKKLGGDISP